MRPFLRSREGASWIAILVFAAILSALAGYSFYELTLRSFIASKTDEKATALQLVDAFVTNYSNIRSDLAADSAPVPASFRAHSIELFNRSRGAATALRVRWIGREGRAIATPPSDAQMAATIESFVGQAEPRPVTEFLGVDDERVFRTIYPSIAREQSCVECHNKLQPELHWRLNDVMGAFSLDAPIGPFLSRLRLECVAMALAVFALVGGVGLWVSLGHYRRIVALSATEAALRDSEHRTQLAHQRAEQSEALLRDAIGTASQGFAIFDAEDRLAVFSDSYKTLYGDSADSVVPGAKFEEIMRAGLAHGQFPEAVGHEEEWLAAKVQMHRQAGTFEVRLSDGRWLLATRNRLANNWLTALVVDITSLKATQTALRESEVLLRDAIDSIAGVFMIYDSEDRIVLSNTVAHRRFADCAEFLASGTPYAEYLRAAVAKGHFPEAAGREDEWIAARIERHRAADGAFEYRLRDDQWGLISEQRMSNGGIATVGLNITGMKEAQEALRASEQRMHDARQRAEYSEALLRDAIDSISGGFVIFDADDRIVLVNSAARRAFHDCGETLEPGTPYADYLGQIVSRGHYLDAIGQEEAWLSARIASHSAATGAAEYRLGNGRWALITERRMGNGGIAAVAVDITALKDTQAALHEREAELQRARERAEATEARLRDAIDSISGGFVIYDADDRIVLFNEVTKRAYRDCAAVMTPGARYADVLWATIEKDHYPEATGREKEWFSERLERHRAAAGAAEYQTRNGRWALITERRMRDGGIAAVGIDITEIKATQEALRASEQRMHDARQRAEYSEALLRDAIDSISGAFIIWDAEDRLALLNHTARNSRRDCGDVQKIGTPYADYMRTVVAKGYYPEALGREGAWLAGQIERHQAARGSFEYQASDGRWLLVTERRTGNGGITTVAVDVTSLKSAQAALAASEAHLNRAQSIAHMGSNSRNLVTGETTWSDEIFRIFGVSRESFVATTENFLRLVHPEDRVAIDSTRELIKSGSALRPQEFRIVRPDGSVRHLYRESEVICDDTGKPVIVNRIIQDVTEQRRTEAALAQAQKMEAIGTLTGGISHDFNNLLGIIIGNLDLLHDMRKDDTAADELAQNALVAAMRGADLTRYLLAFARRQPLQAQRVDANELVSGITRLLRRVLGEQIEIVLNLATEVWPIVVDPALLDSAIMNLATNARDAMPNGGRLIIATGNRTLDAEYAAERSEVTAGDYTMIEVSDTGTGMPTEVAARIFEPFYTTKEQGRGTGLGLSMVFGFVKQSGGHIEVYSELGEGTTFRLYLPRRMGEAVASNQPINEEMLQGRGETVLAVEDNTFLRRVLVRQLNELGYRVLEAANAEAGFSVLSEQKIDLLLTDIVMPGGFDGIELARRAFKQRADLKIILTSGFSETRLDNHLDALPQGIRLLTKPYRKLELAAALRAVLDA